MNAPRIEADFVSDLCGIWLRDLRKAGYRIPSGTRFRSVGELYFNALRRLIPPRVRNVVWSGELKARELGEAHFEAIERISAASNRGENLGPFLSKSLLDPSFNDGLLNDWGIHHFHLGDPAPEGEFVARTRELLFVYVSETTLYLIELLDHQAFSCNELFEVLHGNWPDLIRPFRMEGFEFSSSVSPSERAMLRKAGFELFTQTSDGTVYAGPGGGQMFSGLSFEARRMADAACRRANAIQRFLEQQSQFLSAEIESQLGVVIPATGN